MRSTVKHLLDVRNANHQTVTTFLQLHLMGGSAAQKIKKLSKSRLYSFLAFISSNVHLTNIDNKYRHTK